MELEDIPFIVNRSIEQYAEMVEASPKEIKEYLTKEWSKDGK